MIVVWPPCHYFTVVYRKLIRIKPMILKFCPDLWWYTTASLVWSIVPLGNSRLQTTVLWSMATSASVWSREYPKGLRAVALASGLSVESSLVTPVYPQLYHPLPSSSSCRSWEDRETPYQKYKIVFEQLASITVVCNVMWYFWN
jgi:hypothetical protein